MKKILTIVPILVIFFSLVYLLLHFGLQILGLGPWDTSPRHLMTTNCRNGYTVSINRRKEAFFRPDWTEYRIVIEREQSLLLEEKLTSAEFWLDLEAKDIEVLCAEDTIEVYAKRYFDYSYAIGKDRMSLVKTERPLKFD